MASHVDDSRRSLLSELTRIQFTNACLSHWAGMGDYLLLPPDQSYALTLRYAGEAPRGDSYHVAEIGEQRLPGYAWGCEFFMSVCSSYLAFSWMPELFARRTMVLNVRSNRYFVLPQYIYSPRIEWPLILDNSRPPQKPFASVGTEIWMPVQAQS